MKKQIENAEQFFDWISLPLSIVGVWPLKQTYYRFYGWILYFMIYLIMAYADLIATFGDFDLMMLSFMEISLHTMMFVRLIVFRFSKLLERVIIEAKRNVSLKNFENDDEKEIYFHYYYTAVSFISAVTPFSCCASIMYTTKPLQEYFIAGWRNETIMLTTPYRVRAFFDLTNKRNIILTYIFQLPISCITLFYVASIGLLVILVFNVCGRLSVLSYRIVNLDSGAYNNSKKIFRGFVEEHLKIVWMAKSIENVFHMVLLNELVSTTLLTALIIYMSLMNIDSFEMAGMTVFGFCALTMTMLLFANCLIGEQLNLACGKLRDAFCECNWYDMPLSYKKALIICIAHTHVPLQLTAGRFYVFSLNSFTDIIKRTMAYVSMLRTMQVNPL